MGENGIGVRLTETLFAPTSLVALALAAAAIVGIVLVARRRAGTAASEPLGARPDMAPPPLLATELSAPRLDTPARTPTLRGMDRLGERAWTLGFVGLGGAVLAALAAYGTAGSGTQEVAGQEGAWEDEVVVTGRLADGPCGARAAHAAALTACIAGAPVTYEVLGISRDGERLSEAAWSDASRRASVLIARGAPAPFTLGAAVLLPGASTADLSAYDALVVVGYADPARDGEDAEARAVTRSGALRDFALAALRGGAGQDCRSDAVVHTVSLGAKRGEPGPEPSPLVLGVRSAGLVNAPGGAPDLTGELDRLFGDDAAGLLGFMPEDYGPWRHLSTERACARSPI